MFVDTSGATDLLTLLGPNRKDPNQRQNSDTCVLKRTTLVLPKWCHGMYINNILQLQLFL